jgi:hypothetical protein
MRGERKRCGICGDWKGREMVGGSDGGTSGGRRVVGLDLLCDQFGEPACWAHALIRMPGHEHRVTKRALHVVVCLSMV